MKKKKEVQVNIGRGVNRFMVDQDLAADRGTSNVGCGSVAEIGRLANCGCRPKKAPSTSGRSETLQTVNLTESMAEPLVDDVKRVS